MTLVVGLGNPGRRYAATRHNLGARVLDALADRLSLRWVERTRPPVTVARAGSLLLTKPLTFMNDSGSAIASLARQHRLQPTDIWVVLDDLDLPLGTLRLRHTGSHGGHQGLASVIERVGSQEVHRLRIGIGSNRDVGVPAETYVLQQFKPDERLTIARAIDQAVGVLERECVTTEHFHR